MTATDTPTSPPLADEFESTTVGERKRPKEDSRPQKGGWAPGGYLNDCQKCAARFIGDKRAVFCADCAYERAEKGRSILSTSEAVNR